MCRNAKLYPTALVCVCFYTTVADICEVILEGATTVLEIIRRTGFASGCGKYCPTMAARILRANGYETPEDQYGFHYPQGTMAVRDLPAEIAKDYPYNHVDQEREKYYQEDIMEDVNFWWPKEGK